MKSPNERSGEPRSTGPGPVRILHLEDQPHDVTLIREALELDHLDCQLHNAVTREGFVSALEKKKFDLILSDFALPTFDGLSALAIAKELAPDLPFIFVSGAMGEDRAVESLRNGATDYVLKQRLTRLGPAVIRALREGNERRARERAESQLRQGQKMEAIGRLAGGVAHDFNNLLTAILGHSGLLRQRGKLTDEMDTDLTEVERAATRAAALTRQLLAFSRQQVLQPCVLDLNAVIVDLDKMLRRLIGEHIDLLTVPSVALGRVMADPGQIEQVVMNLVVNARDAMPKGGRLTIETANVQIAEELIEGQSGLAPGAYVMLAVSDDGTGMDAQTQARIFEPFFTTKEVGKGTGLGLSTVHGIVEQSGGHIEVYSEPKHGTTFKIYLPLVEASSDATLQVATLAARKGGSESILIVEDEDVVRHVVSEALRAAGYTVIEAVDRAEALSVCQACLRTGTALDLMLTDVIMPGMPADELAQALEALHLELKVLHMSGYTDTSMLHRGVLDASANFLQKPFTIDALLRKVRDVLGGASAAAA
jgi:two-component system, cell cycle sensor histidine kinase and response regulator CckA